MIFATLLCVLFSFILYWLILARRKLQFFKERNVKHIKPNLLLGNSTDSLFGRLQQSDVIDRVYKAYPEEDIVGHYELLMPNYVIRNPDLVVKVLVKEFSHFHDRVKMDGKIESPEEANMFILSGNTWRAIRNKFSPLFTSGKLKYMFNTMTDCGKNLDIVLENKVGKEVDMCDIMGMFTMDVIGSTAFGIEPNVLQNPASEFREKGKKLFQGSFIAVVKLMVTLIAPKIAKILGFTGFFDKDVIKYFNNILINTIKHRRKENFERNDFVQMLIQLKDKGKIEIQTHDSGDDYLQLEDSGTYELEITDDILIGGAFSFITAGFHATAMALAFTLFHLAQEPDIVEKLREEIKEHVAGEEPAYHELKAMPYLENVLKESMRMHPPASIISRVCTKEYTFPNGLVVQPGVTVFVPVMSIHMDPEVWPHPEVFNPDRFQAEAPPRPGTYLAFGDGPRVCIAMRFAMLEMKYALVKLVKNYTFELSEKTELPLKMNARAFLLTPKNGITFRVKKA